jgi:hypothetical protein
MPHTGEGDAVRVVTQVEFHFRCDGAGRHDADDFSAAADAFPFKFSHEPFACPCVFGVAVFGVSWTRPIPRHGLTF